MDIAFYFLIQLLITLGFHFAWHLRYWASDSLDAHNEKRCRIASTCILGFTFVVYLAASLLRLTAKDFGGADIFHYYRYYIQAGCSFSEYGNICSMELGFRFLMWSMFNIGVPFRGFLLLVHSLMFVAVAMFSSTLYRRKESFSGFLATMLVTGDLIVAFCLVRNEMAVALSLIFFIMLVKKAYKKALIPMFLAISIHISALILLPLYFLVLVMDCSVVSDLKGILCWVASFAFAMLWVFPIIDMVVVNTRYAYYIGSDGIAVGTFLALLLVTVCIWLGGNSKLAEQVPYRYLMVAWLCLPLQLHYSIFYRSLLYFMPLLFVLISEQIDSVGEYPFVFDRVKRRLIFNTSVMPKFSKDVRFKPENYLPLIRCGLKLIMLFYLILRLVKMYTADYASYGLYPYQFFF